MNHKGSANCRADSPSPGANASGAIDEKATGAHASVTYNSYARMDELLRLRQPVTGADTEPSFIVLSQVQELLFSLLVTEFELVRSQLHHDDLDGALWTIRRTVRIQSLATNSWDALSALSPNEFLEIRPILGTASGIQSLSYRKLEFLLGNRDSDVLARYKNTEAYKELTDVASEPSVYDEALSLLRRMGAFAPSEQTSRHGDQEASSDPSAVEAWRAVYVDRSLDRRLVLLAEALVDVAECFGRWRYHHLLVVQRQLGMKGGTGGTSGVDWLRKISDHRFFAELWDARTML